MQREHFRGQSQWSAVFVRGLRCFPLFCLKGARGLEEVARVVGARHSLVRACEDRAFADVNGADCSMRSDDSSIAMSEKGKKAQI